MKLFSKIAALSVGLAMAVGVGVAVDSKKVSAAHAETATWDAASLGFSNEQQLAGESYSFSDSNVSITFGTKSGNGHKWFNSGSAIRSYGGNSFTISCSNGTLTSITLSNNQSKEVDANVGTYSSNSWTGNSSSVTFTVQSGSGNFRTSTISAVYTTGGGGEEDPVLQSIAVSGEKTEYNVGDEFVKPTVTATYDKGDPEDVTESATFTGYSMSVAGEYTVTVSFGGKTTTYDITVVDPTVGEILYTCDFRTADTHGYTQNKEFTLSEKQWVSSVSQVNSSVFYLGTNTTAGNVPYGILNDNESFADVVAALAGSDSTYETNKSTAHAYALRFENSYTNVGRIKLDWIGTNNVFQIYIFGDQGDGLVELAHVEAENGTSTPGTISWTATGYGEDFSSIVIVARPGASSSTATSKTFRPSVFTIYEGETEPVDPTKDTLVILLNDATPSPISLPYSNGGLWYANDKDGNDIDVEWSSSNEAVFTMSENGNNVGVCTPVGPGTANIIAHAEGYNDGVFVLTITIGDLSSITVTGSMTKTEYLVGEPWNAGGLVATGTYSTGYSCDVTSQVDWSYTPTSPVVAAKSVVATATIGTVSGDSAAQSVSVTKTNPLRAIYDMADGAEVDVYGYYVGFAKGTGPVIMDGEYGMIVYSKTHDVSSYEEGKTILHVTGSLSIYKGLYEISGTVSITKVESADVSTPVTYTVSGTPTKYEQSRLTYVTGVPTTGGNLDGTPGAADITLTFTKGSATTTVFFKKAAQTSENMAALKEAVTAGDEITVKCFTGWYNAFQVQFDEVVEVVEDYTAEDFAQQLLNLTDAVCEDYDGVTNNKDALVVVWNILNDSEHYNALPTAQKNILKDANADEKGSTVEQAIARYEYLCAKYGLSQFIEGRAEIPVKGNYTGSISYQSSIDSSSSITIIVIVAVTSMTLLGVTLVLRKRKHQ